MTDTTYRLAWLIYLLACGGIAWVLWQLVKNHLRWGAWRVVLPVFAFLLTPYFSDPAQSRLAPAILTVLFEGLFGDPAMALKASVPVIVAVFIAVTASLLASRRRARHP